MYVLTSFKLGNGMLTHSTKFYSLIILEMINTLLKVSESKMFSTHFVTKILISLDEISYFFVLCLCFETHSCFILLH